MVIFGDSYSDCGEFIRMSNGPLWPEHLSRKRYNPLIGVPAVRGGRNYARSGAMALGTSSHNLPGQFHKYSEDTWPGNSEEDQWHIIFIGTNDIAMGKDVNFISDGIHAVVDQLEKYSYRVIVVGVPNLANTPRHLNSEPSERIRLYREGHRLNGKLQDRTGPFVDIFEVTTKITSNPEVYGFVNARDHTNYHPLAQGHVFWDTVHWTGKFHKLVADLIDEVMV